MRKKVERRRRDRIPSPASELLLFTRRATSRFLMKELRREGRLPEFRRRPMVILRGDREIPVEIPVCRRAC